MTTTAAETVSKPPATPGPRSILVCDKLDPDGLAVLAEAGCDVRERLGLSEEELIEAVADVDAVVVRSATKITAPVLAAGKKLRVVGRAGIGVDNIDVAAATREGVLVMNTPTANAITTGELALAHLFSLARHVAEADRSMHAGRWDKKALVGTEITGKTLVVVGLGKIGRVVAERALGLRMRVVAYDPYLQQGDSPVPGVELVDWDTALRQGDFFSIHVPKTKETVGVINAAALAKMKSTACLINCARGGIVVESDLVEALESGTIAGAALDVFETEPLPEDSPLRSVPHLVLTPHLGASSGEAQKRVSVEIAKQLVRFLETGEAQGALNAPSLSADALAELRPYITLARRCGMLLAQLADVPPERVEIVYRGELTSLDTQAVRLEVVAGLLAPTLDGPVNAVNAPIIASERGLKVLEEKSLEKGEYTALLEVRTRSGGGKAHQVAGTVFRGEPRLVGLDGFGIDAVPDGAMLLTHHHDRPGTLGLVATWLGGRAVNINALHMGVTDPDSKTALALYQLDRPLTAEEQTELETLEPILTARVILL